MRRPGRQEGEERSVCARAHHGRQACQVVMRIRAACRSATDHAFHLQGLPGKVHQQRMLLAYSAQVGSDNGEMDVLNGFDSLQFDDDRILDEKVEPMLAYLGTIVVDEDLDLV